MVYTSESKRKGEMIMNKAFFKDLKEEYNKIIWPSKNSMVKKTTAVVLSSVMMGAIISMSDYIFQHMIGIIVKLF